MKEVMLVVSSALILILSVICFEQSRTVRHREMEIIALQKECKELNDELSSYRYLKDRMDGIDSYVKWSEHAYKPSTIRRIEALRKIEIQ